MRFSRDDLMILNNALNCILNGPYDIPHWEFHSLIGAEPDEAAALLGRVHMEVERTRISKKN